MSYSFVVPPELLADLCLIRKITKESIASLIRTAIHERSKKVVEGMKIIHSADYIDKLAVEMNKPFIVKENQRGN